MPNVARQNGAAEFDRHDRAHWNCLVNLKLNAGARDFHDFAGKMAVGAFQVGMNSGGIAWQTRLASVQLILRVCGCRNLVRHPGKSSLPHDGAISHAAKAINC